MRVYADRESCISGGRCMATLPEVFDQDDEGLVVVLTSRPAPEHHARTRKAAYLCPARAIDVTEGPSAN
ncbi:4Fe-4S domain-containing protein [Streptomyces sp. NPDC005955]|uniref:ferredoxin n=1 Tax=Streptomyces sp. NPDC005955 TaxID=3364738 RepID=UPI0036988ACB